MEAAEGEEEESAFEVQQMRKWKKPKGLKSGKAVVQVPYKVIKEMTLLQTLHTVNAISLNLR
jgi:hypothetical protein